jgi:TonB family protein
MKKKISFINRRKYLRILSIAPVFLLLFLIGTSQASAQLIVNKSSFDLAVKTLRAETKVPLRLPTVFIPSSAGEKGKPLLLAVTGTLTDSFALEYCFTKVCEGKSYYGRITGEKITEYIEEPFGKPVKLARGITGYFEVGERGHRSIIWDQDGYRYRVELNSKDNVNTLTRFANSAINNDSLIKNDVAIKAPINQTSQNIKTIQGGVLNGRATSLPDAPYPAKAKAANARGVVNVQVLVDENGNVISAKAMSGNSLLHPAAVQAARQAKFKPMQVSGQSVRVSGIIVYNFAP